MQDKRTEWSRIDAGLWQQTRSLLYKNVLIKWRTKQQSSQEVILPLLLLTLLIFISNQNPHVSYPAVSTTELEENDVPFTSLGYTPVTNVTTPIMERVASRLDLGRNLKAFGTEEELEQASALQPTGLVGVVFHNATAYSLRFPYNQLPRPSDFAETVANCLSRSASCRAANYWHSGFVPLQVLVDSAIVQMWLGLPELDPVQVKAVMMGQPAFVEVHKFPHALISIYLVLAFTPFVTFLIANVAAEKERRVRDTMTMMGLYDTAFWMSWGLLYAALVSAMSFLMAVIATFTPLFPKSDFPLVFALIFLYGISSIFFSFMVTPLFEKPKFASTVGSMLTVVLACLSLFTILLEDFPRPLVWILCLFSPAAFSVGVAQVVYLEAHGAGAVWSSLTSGPYPLYVPLVMLPADCLLYLLLAVYLDQVLPGKPRRKLGSFPSGPSAPPPKSRRAVIAGELRVRRSPFYFLKPSYWSRRSQRYVEVGSARDVEVNGASGGGEGETVEPVSPEFRGREAIRINDVSKVYDGKDETVEALRGLTFDIYEGQITALLGHSGSGKSTLLNVLCGICSPGGGRAAIYGAPVGEVGPEMKRLVGVCPQFNILFEVLTVEEHLRIFAAIKGIPPPDVHEEVCKVLKDLDMDKIRTARAKNLSRGQKRKLSVGIAVLGDPKVLLLDEPTAGMDPCSRHGVWSLLRSRRAGRALVLSTRCAHEADVLADRKAVISQGRLKCVGSSLFLKTKCGVGYHLRMSIDDGCDTDAVNSLVRRHVPKAKLTQRQEAELKFTLPFESMHAFAGLFSEMDSRLDLGLVNYGVSMTTLEDVFLHLEADTDVDQAAYGVFNQEAAADECEGVDKEAEGRQLMFSDKSELLRGGALWRQQFSCVAWFHTLNLWRERKAFTYSLFLLLVFVAAMLAVSHSTGANQIRSPALQFEPMYLLGGKQPPARSYASKLLVRRSTVCDLRELIDNLERQDIAVELKDFSDYVAVAPHSAAVEVTERDTLGCSKLLEMSFTLAFNSTTVHSLPMTVNILSNAILGKGRSGARIQTWSKPFPYRMPAALAFALLFIESVLLGMLAAGVPAYFAMEHIRDRELKCRSTLRVSGLLPSAYWCGRAAVDVPFYYLLVSCMTVVLFSFHPGELLTSANVNSVIVCTLGFAPAVILFTYVCSFAFSRVQSNRDFFSVISMMVCVVSAALVHLPLVGNNRSVMQVLHNILCTVNPFYPLMGCLNCIAEATFFPSYSDWSLVLENLIISIVAPYLQCLVLMLALRCLERRRAVGAARCCRMSSRRKSKEKRDVEGGRESQEDPNVQTERLRVKEALGCSFPERRPLVIASNLRKKYKRRRDALAQGKSAKVAVKNISFCVGKGEVLGLLGPNGSGKSTLMNMLAGETEPTAGRVLLGEPSRGEPSRGEPSRGGVGYCPQVNPLWPRITLQEHLEIYAAVKGLKGQHVPGIVQRVVNALELKEHAHKRARSLPAGLKRKLCFALSMMGNPETVLLDEPASGMDPKSKRHLWRALRAAMRERQRGAVLTLHHMEEAEAVCDRVGILVSGRLRCLGSIQHLKAKYGRGYGLEVKLGDRLAGPRQAALLHDDILSVFPNAVRQNGFATLMEYKVPTEDVRSLAAAFSHLERMKQTYKFEEYNLSQSTLEQVFLEFAKEQEDEDDEPGSLSTTFRWRRLTDERLLADRSVSDNQGESVVQQL